MISLSSKKGRLEGRVALVTGASRGIGAAVARGFAREGAHVILLARTVAGLEETDDAIRAEGGAATLLPLDLSRPDQISLLGPVIAERFRRLDIFVANAAIIGALSPVAMSDPKNWENVMKVNVLANYHLIRTLDPLLRGSDAGRAIFVTSGAFHAPEFISGPEERPAAFHAPEFISGPERPGAARMHMPFWGAYAASKASLEEMAATYAAEVAYSNLKINILDPGAVRTLMRAEAFPGEDPLTLPEPDSVVEKFIALAA